MYNGDIFVSLTGSSASVQTQMHSSQRLMFVSASWKWEVASRSAQILQQHWRRWSSLIEIPFRGGPIYQGQRGETQHLSWPRRCVCSTVGPTAVPPTPTDLRQTSNRRYGGILWLIRKTETNISVTTYCVCLPNPCCITIFHSLLVCSLKV